MTKSEELLKIKAELDTVDPVLRTVEFWNSAREGFKERYTKETVKALDASGYIVSWLGNNKNKKTYKHYYKR